MRCAVAGLAQRLVSFWVRIFAMDPLKLPFFFATIFAHLKLKAVTSCIVVIKVVSSSCSVCIGLAMACNLKAKMNGHMQRYWLQSKTSTNEFGNKTHTHMQTNQRTNEQTNRKRVCNADELLIVSTFHPPSSIFYARLQLDSILTHEYEDTILTKIQTMHNFENQWTDDDTTAAISMHTCTCIAIAWQWVWNKASHFTFDTSCDRTKKTHTPTNSRTESEKSHAVYWTEHTGCARVCNVLCTCVTDISKSNNLNETQRYHQWHTHTRAREFHFEFQQNTMPLPHCMHAKHFI